MINLVMGSKIHFIGVGGVSMSKLCAYFVRNGYTCSGSDRADTEVLNRLKILGANVYAGTKPEYATQADIVVFSSAIDAYNAELVTALEIGIPVLERKEFMRCFTAAFDNVIAVSGAHGKTSTCGMLTYIMLCAAKRVTAHIGGDIQGVDNLQLDYGNEMLVIEACEYKKSFLEFKVDYGIILNVDYDHPDCYANIDEVYGAFVEFAHHASKALIIENDYYPKIHELHYAIYRNDINNVITYGDNFNADFCYMNIERIDTSLTFDVYRYGEFYHNFKLNTFNAVNVKCATAAIAAADSIGIEKGAIATGLTMFGGIKRRAECLGKSINGAKVITDYAHHPSEIELLLHNVRAVTRGKIIAVFEPHTYSRSKALANEFASALKLSDACYLLPTYAAREKGDFDSSRLNETFKKRGLNAKLIDYDNISESLLKFADNDVILLIGAGIDYMRIYKSLV